MKSPRVFLSLRTLVIAPIALTMVAAIALIAVTAYAGESRASAEFAGRSLSSIAEVTRTHLAEFLGSPFRATIQLADTASRIGFALPGREVEREAFVRDAFTIVGDLTQIGAIGIGTEGADYVGFRRESDGRLTLMAKDRYTAGKLVIYDGSVRSSPTVTSFDGYDPRTRPWYLPVEQSRQALWSPIYTDYDERQAVTITACAPIFDGTRLVGVLASDVKLEAFDSFLSSQKGGARPAEIYVVDENDLLVAGSDGVQVLADGKGVLAKGSRIPAKGSGDGLVASSSRALFGTGVVAPLRILFTGKPYYCGFVPYSGRGGLSWNIVVAMPEEELIGPAGGALERSMGAALLAALIASALGLLVLNGVARRMRNSSDAAEAIASGALSTRLPENSRIREIDRLSRAFNAMTDGLAKANAELEARVAERTEQLSGANARLEVALDELKRTQAQMILAEKMASLGQVIAGIAHELNTPLAAIASTNRLLDATATVEIVAIAEAWDGLGAEARSIVEAARLHNSAENYSPADLDPAADRARTKEIESMLEGSGVIGARSVAADLVACGLSASDRRAIAIASGSEGPAFVTALRGVVQLVQAVRVIDESVQKASRVVTALRAYVRKDPNGEVVELDLAADISAIVTLYYGRLKKGIALATDFSGGTSALGRRDELNQVWINLIGNAVQAVGPGGRISIRTASGDDWIEVSIEDDGKGIPEAIKDRIFEPFFSTKRPGEGSGIGLALARRIARTDGGDIRFESEPGRTVFTVRLPKPRLESTAKANGHK